MPVALRRKIDSDLFPKKSCKVEIFYKPDHQLLFLWLSSQVKNDGYSIVYHKMSVLQWFVFGVIHIDMIKPTLCGVFNLYD